MSKSVARVMHVLWKHIMLYVFMVYDGDMAGGPEKGISQESVYARANREHSLHREGLGLVHVCTAPHDLTNIEGKRVKAGEPTFGNQCAARLMTMLIAVGLKIPPRMIKMTCGVHSPEAGHWVRAREAAETLDALAKTGNLPGFQRAEKISRGEVEKFFAEAPTAPGIVYIPAYWRRTGESGTTGDHIDLWNGFRTPAKSAIQNFFTVGILSNYRHAREVWFWKAVDGVQQGKRAEHDFGGAVPQHALSAATLALVSKASADMDMLLGQGSFSDNTGAVIGNEMEMEKSLKTPANISASNHEDNGAVAHPSRRAFATGLAAAFTVPFMVSEAHGQQRVRGRGRESGEQREAQFPRVVKAFEDKIVERHSVLNSGKAQDVLAFVLSYPKIPHYEQLHAIEVRALFPRVHKKYLSPAEEQHEGLLSFPIVPSSYTPTAVYDRKTTVPTQSELQNSAKTVIFDGSMIYASGIRVRGDRRLLPPLYRYALADGSEQALNEIFAGRQTFSVDRNLGGTVFDKAGVLGFDFTTANNAHGKWVSLCWAKNPQIAEDTGFSDPRKQYWDHQIEGGFMYDLEKSAALKSVVVDTILKIKGTSDAHQLQKKMLLATHTGARLFVTSSDDTAFFEAQMQQVGGAAVVSSDAAHKPVLIGQVMWRIDLPRPDGGIQVAFLVSGAEQTKAAIEG